MCKGKKAQVTNLLYKTSTMIPPHLHLDSTPRPLQSQWIRWGILCSIFAVYLWMESSNQHVWHGQVTLKGNSSLLDKDQITTGNNVEQRSQPSNKISRIPKDQMEHTEPKPVAMTPSNSTMPPGSDETDSNASAGLNITSKSESSPKNDNHRTENSTKSSSIPNVEGNVSTTFTNISKADSSRAKAKERAATINKKNESIPNFVWLMSFPNSGTTYTNKLVQGVSKTTTATNYGLEQLKHTSVPISPDFPDGPYYRYPKWNHSNYVLTKTHCGGYCIRCQPDHYVETVEQFETDCLSGNKMVDGKEIDTKPAYSRSLPKKAVHIIRDPYSNIVARLHMQRKNWAKHKDREEYLKLFTSDTSGFRKWCRFVEYISYNKTYGHTVIDKKAQELFHEIPCPADFYRYVQWHNYAVEVTEERLGIPVHRISYENYSASFNSTVDQLLDFLELPRIGKAPTFITGKTYRGYFTRTEQFKIKELIQHLATKKTWALLSHYFDGLVAAGENNTDV